MKCKKLKKGGKKILSIPDEFNFWPEDEQRSE